MVPRKIIVIFIALMMLLLLAFNVMEQSGYDVDWWTTDGGGYTWSEGGGYSLGGTIGQPDARALSGGGYTLAGGFWSGIVALIKNYLPLIMR
jgi:hypothetical protein